MSKHLTPASVRANIPLPETATVPPGGISVGQELTLEVSDLAFGGEGVCRVENFVIFVPFTIPGEKITAQVTEVKRQYARAKLLKV
ncbi:MAG: TRAM domain-containing protein, partial [Candidatus Methanomethylophilaceae archaeon]|nr:TRAM domain-containing protein [Candidatus Methanomethylophilaceae archaeon]